MQPEAIKQSEGAMPLTYSIVGAARALGVAERSIYRMMDEGTLRRMKAGRRTLIPAADVVAIAGGE